ncbi:MAG: hypothetical protein KGY70_15830, partial [Bacteroidales bacterium]|nr:hypothetical protein [Bacteroidales bacterium]
IFLRCSCIQSINHPIIQSPNPTFTSFRLLTLKLQRQRVDKPTFTSFRWLTLKLQRQRVDKPTSTSFRWTSIQSLLLSISSATAPP